VLLSPKVRNVVYRMVGMTGCGAGGLGGSGSGVVTGGSSGGDGAAGGELPQPAAAQVTAIAAAANS
jgi:hypothetical protein